MFADFLWNNFWSKSLFFPVSLRSHPPAGPSFLFDRQLQITEIRIVWVLQKIQIKGWINIYIIFSKKRSFICNYFVFFINTFTTIMFHFKFKPYFISLIYVKKIVFFHQNVIQKIVKIKINIYIVFNSPHDPLILVTAGPVDRWTRPWRFDQWWRFSFNQGFFDTYRWDIAGLEDEPTPHCH